MDTQASDTFSKDLFTHKVVVVTGATSGIGQAVAIAFAKKGAKVWALGLNSKEAQYPQQLNIESVELDVTDEDKVANFFKNLNQLDVLFNGAGIGSTTEHELPMFKKVVDINLTAVFYISECAAPLLAKSSGGSIINVSSMYSIFGSQLTPAYASSKGAIDQLTKSHAIYLAKDNIRVNAVAPGWIDTPMIQQLKVLDGFTDGIVARTPLARFGNPIEVANVVLFLASDAASWITGTIVNVDGGYSIV